MSETRLLILDSGYFCAAVEVGLNDVVIRAAPIIKYMKEWPAKRVEEYATKKGWKIDAG